MTITVIGGPDSGKSLRAESILCDMSDADHRYYIATMIPYEEEGRARVEKHRNMRKCKGFVTIEQPLDVADALCKIESPSETSVLLECITNLAANEMFERHCFDVNALTEKIIEDVNKLKDSVKNIVIVSNSFAKDESFDQETRLYVQLMNRLNEELQKISDQCIMIEHQERL